MSEQNNQMTVNTEVSRPSAAIADVKLGNHIFGGLQEFQLAQRMANALASSTIVPKDYQGNMGIA